MSGYVEPTAGTTTEPSSTKFGNKPIRALMKLFSGVELDTAPSYGSAYIPNLATPFHIRADKFFLRNPANTFGTSFVSAALTANQKINIPILENVVSSVKQDEPAFLNQTQTLKKKTIPISGTDPNIITDATANDTHLAAFNASGQLEKKTIASVNTHTHAHTDIGTNLKHSESGLTAVRTVTHPNEDYKAMGELNITEFKNKTFDLRQNNPIKFARLGAYAPATSMSTANDSWGVLRGMVHVGIPFAKNLGLAGQYHRYATYGTVVDDVAGVLKLDGWTAHRTTNPKIRFGNRFNANTSNVRRMFSGWGPQRIVTVSSDTAPLSNTESGILFGHGTTDTNFHVFHNDGTGVCQKTSMGIALPAVATNYHHEIVASESGASFTVTLYAVDSSGNRGAVQGSPLVLTSRIPASTTALYMQNLISGSTTTQQFNEPYFIEVY